MIWPQFARVGVALLGSPIEVIRRGLGYHYKVERTYTYTCPETNRTMMVVEGWPYDSFTWAPNLRNADGSRSIAAAIHDTGWKTAQWDDGTRLTFDENNRAFEHILESEGHPEWIIGCYVWGVSLPRMRRLWERTHGPDHPAPVWHAPPPCMDV